MRGAAESSGVVDVLGAVEGEQRRIAVLLPRGRGQVSVRRELAQRKCVHHHVADQLRALGEPLVVEVGHRRRGRGEEQVGQVVGHDPVALLGHAPVEGAQASFDVREPRAPAIVDGQLCGDDAPRPGSSSCRRRRGRRPARSSRSTGSRRRIISPVIVPVRTAADLQVQRRRRHLEVAEEGRAHRVVVVLAGVDRAVSSWPAPASARLTGAAFTNCGRAPTTVGTFTPPPGAASVPQPGQCAGERALRRRRAAARRRRRRCRPGAAGFPTTSS